MDEILAALANVESASDEEIKSLLDSHKQKEGIANANLESTVATLESTTADLEVT